jgi:hypothetical protein
LATEKAKLFIETVLLPELARSPKKSETGLNGHVIPPRLVTDFDERSNWAIKKSTKVEFTLCHGDLGPYNLMFGPRTFEVVGVIDWECAGYFPELFATL